MGYIYDATQEMRLILPGMGLSMAEFAAMRRTCGHSNGRAVMFLGFAGHGSHQRFILIALAILMGASCNSVPQNGNRGVARSPILAPDRTAACPIRDSAIDSLVVKARGLAYNGARFADIGTYTCVLAEATGKVRATDPCGATIVTGPAVKLPASPVTIAVRQGVSRREPGALGPPSAWQDAARFLYELRHRAVVG